MIRPIDCNGACKITLRSKEIKHQSSKPKYVPRKFPQIVEVLLPREQPSILSLLDDCIHAGILETSNTTAGGERIDIDNDVPRQIFVRLRLQGDRFRVEPRNETTKYVRMFVFHNDTDSVGGVIFLEP